MRLALWLSALLTTTAVAGPVPYQGGTRVTFTPLPAVSDAPAQKARYVGGYEVKGEGTSWLTGLSDLVVKPGKDGVMIDAIGDYGSRARFTLPVRGTEGPLSVEMLRAADGKPFGNKSLSDAEDMALDPRDGTVYVSFEGDARVMRYGPDLGGPGERLPLTGLPALPSNEGLEAVTLHLSAKGEASLILGAEVGGFWKCALDTYRCETLTGPTTPGFTYKLVSLAPLDPAKPDEMLALYRFYLPVVGARNVLRVLRLEGNRLKLVDTILRIEPPLPIDNYEGVSAVKTRDGYRLYLISDPIGDNDPTHLLMFDYRP
ncbi:esterase-like activity of phytase family protein [Asticcacaulis sp. W401b]|uniref:esterase-like activity of phytase family protein n=3 Tax=unclassified Asticcacaulis TaxID=2628350 RepID=UPI003970B09B